MPGSTVLRVMRQFVVLLGFSHVFCVNVDSGSRVACSPHAMPALGNRTVFHAPIFLAVFGVYVA